MANLLFPTLKPGGAASGMLDSKIDSFLVIKDSAFGMKMNCLIKEYAWEAKERIQETFTLGDTSYLYYLGPSSQALAVSGVCPVVYTDKDKSVAKGSEGYSQFLKFYATDSIQKTRKPLDIMLGTQVYKGFITGASLMGASSEGVDMHGFKLVMIVLPMESK